MARKARKSSPAGEETSGRHPVPAKLIDAIRRASKPILPIPTRLSPLTSSLPDIRAVLFDVYGTLFVSASGDIGVASATSDADAFTAACAWALQESVPQSVGELAIEWLHETILAEHTRLQEAGTTFPEVDIREMWTEVVHRLLNEKWLTVPPPTPEQIEGLALGYELAVNPVWPMPGVRQTLDELAARGMALGIVSNAQFHTRLLFDALLGASLPQLGFADNLCLWSYTIRHGKPSRRLFELAGRQLAAQGVAPEQIVFVGNDMLNDIVTPAALGWRTILFAGDQRSLRQRRDDPRCCGITPDAVVAELSDILERLPPVD